MADAADLHRALVDGLVARGVITDARVEAAFRVVPRHLSAARAARSITALIPGCDDELTASPSILFVMTTSSR